MRLPSTDRGAIDKLKNHFSKIQIADKDADLDRDPYTAAAWAPMTLSNAATGTIDWVVTFGLPEIPKAVFLYINARDSASAGGTYYFALSARITTTIESIICRCPRGVNDEWGAAHGIVAVADNGTSFYRVVASGVNTMDVYVRAVAWVKA